MQKNPESHEGKCYFWLIVLWFEFTVWFIHNRSKSFHCYFHHSLKTILLPHLRCTSDIWRGWKRIFSFRAVSRGKSRVQAQFSSLLFSTQRVFCFFKHLCQYCIVLDTKGLLFSSIYVNILLVSTQRVFCFQTFM